MGQTASDRQVVEFLRAAGRHEKLDADQLAAYRPAVAGAGRAGTLRWRAVRHLVSQGAVPTPEQVEEEIDRRMARSRRAVPPEIRAQAEAAAPAARAYVAAVRAGTGVGPTWGELAEHLGWPRSQRRQAVRHLVAAGHLFADAAERSLDVTADAVPCERGQPIPATAK